jgi:ABC-type uncharacterized transport system involved in gliding motility auxiliary subunit
VALMRDRLADASLYISLFGLFLLLAAGGLALRPVAGAPPQLAPGLAVAGLVLALLWPVLRPDELRGALGTRQARYGGNTLVLAVSVIGMLAALNFIGTRFYRIWDLTANKRFTLSNQTLQILNDLNERAETVRLTAIFPANESTTTRQDLESLVDKYRQRSGQIEFETVSPEIDIVEFRGLVERLELGETAPGRALIAEAGERHAIVYNFDEQAVTEAIVKATRGEDRAVAFTTGHGEPGIESSSDGASYAGLRGALEREGYAVESVNLAVVTDTLAADAVVVAGAQRPLLDGEVERLAAYVQGGGAVLVLLDPLADANLGGLLVPWEIRVHDDLVVDPARNLLQQANLVAVAEEGYRFHDITRGLERFISVFPGTRSIGLGTPITSTMTVEGLVEASSQAWGETDLTALQESGAQPAKGEGDNLPPLYLAVAGEGGEGMGRIAVFGSSDLVLDGFLQQFGGQLANLDLVLNAVNWLTQDEALIGIRATEPDDRPLSPPQNAGLLTLATAVLAPLAVLAVGTWINWRRR